MHLTRTLPRSLAFARGLFVDGRPRYLSTRTSVASFLSEQSSTIIRHTNRDLLRIEGRDSIKFLQGLVTNDVSKLEDGLYTGFLSAQGRLLYDAFLYRLDASVVIDCHQAVSADLESLLRKHVLRSRVKITRVTDKYAVWSSGRDISGLDSLLCFEDPRHPDLGQRTVTAADDRGLETRNVASAQDYVLRRTLLGVPEGPAELVAGVSLPLESNLDIMGGIDFHKGCYMGQELTIRTHHKGVVRKRILPVQLLGLQEGTPSEPEVDLMWPHSLPPHLADVTSDTSGSPVSRRTDRIAGKFLSGIGNVGLALLRLENADDPGRILKVHNGETELRVMPIPHRVFELDSHQ